MSSRGHLRLAHVKAGSLGHKLNSFRLVLTMGLPSFGNELKKFRTTCRECGNEVEVTVSTIESENEMGGDALHATCGQKTLDI